MTTTYPKQNHTNDFDYDFLLIFTENYGQTTLDQVTTLTNSVQITMVPSNTVFSGANPLNFYMDLTTAAQSKATYSGCNGVGATNLCSMVNFSAQNVYNLFSGNCDQSYTSGSFQSDCCSTNPPGALCTGLYTGEGGNAGLALPPINTEQTITFNDPIPYYTPNYINAPPSIWKSGSGKTIGDFNPNLISTSENGFVPGVLYLMSIANGSTIGSQNAGFVIQNINSSSPLEFYLIPYYSQTGNQFSQGFFINAVPNNIQFQDFTADLTFNGITKTSAKCRFVVNSVQLNSSSGGWTGTIIPNECLYQPGQTGPTGGSCAQYSSQLSISNIDSATVSGLCVGGSFAYIREDPSDSTSDNIIACCSSSGYELKEGGGSLINFCIGMPSGVPCWESWACSGYCNVGSVCDNTLIPLGGNCIYGQDNSCTKNNGVSACAYYNSSNTKQAVCCPSGEDKLYPPGDELGNYWCYNNPDGSCNHDVQCPIGGCVFDQNGVGKCYATNLANGTACILNGQCSSGNCQNGTCEPPIPIGGSCTYGSDSTCSPGNNGAPAACAYQLVNGSATAQCCPNGDVEHQSGDYWCNVGNGDACRWSSQCPNGHSCTDNVCLFGASAGTPCDYGNDYQCAPGPLGPGACARNGGSLINAYCCSSGKDVQYVFDANSSLPIDGDYYCYDNSDNYCYYDVQCPSGYCNNNTCAPQNIPIGGSCVYGQDSTCSPGQGGISSCAYSATGSSSAAFCCPNGDVQYDGGDYWCKVNEGDACVHNVQCPNGNCQSNGTCAITIPNGQPCQAGSGSDFCESGSECANLYSNSNPFYVCCPSSQVYTATSAGERMCVNTQIFGQEYMPCNLDIQCQGNYQNLGHGDCSGNGGIGGSTGVDGICKYS